MKIAIDCSKAVNEKAGIARYTWEIASHLPRIFTVDEFFYFFNFVRGDEEKKKLIKSLISGRKNINYKIFRLPGSFKEKLFPSPFSILNSWIKNSDIYHATEFLSFDRGLKIPQVLTVHDLSMIRFPAHRKKESAKHGKMLALACEKADAIISVSQSTKLDIEKFFNIPAAKIDVVYSGYNTIFRKIVGQQNSEKILKKYHIESPFLLFVGTIEPRKNISNLILAFNKFAQSAEGKKYTLVLAGKHGWNTEEIEKTFNDSRVKEKISFLGYVPDEDLLYLYNNTALFCYPSIFEGFGFPPLEAMACGAPVLSSNVSSLPEVVGSAGKLVDPTDYVSIYNGIRQILSDKVLADKMRQESLLQAKKFSWDKCARDTYRVYKKVLDEK